MEGEGEGAVDSFGPGCRIGGLVRGRVGGGVGRQALVYSGRSTGPHSLLTHRPNDLAVVLNCNLSLCPTHLAIVVGDGDVGG